MRARLQASLAYESQVPFLFGDALGLDRAMRAYALECGLVEQAMAERRWRAADPERPARLLARGERGQGVSGHGVRGR